MTVGFLLSSSLEEMETSSHLSQPHQLGLRSTGAEKLDGFVCTVLGSFFATVIWLAPQENIFRSYIFPTTTLLCFTFLYSSALTDTRGTQS